MHVSLLARGILRFLFPLTVWESPLGTMYYADATRVAIPLPDRDLAHIKFVIVNKLRRNEAFTFSWDKPESDGGGRSSVWISAQIPLEFEFDDATPPEMNREWLEQLSQAASTVNGLTPIPEPEKA